MNKLSDLIVRDQITIKNTHQGLLVDDNAYSCELSLGDKAITIAFRMGTGLSHEPTVLEVMSSVTIDTQTVINYDGNAKGIESYVPDLNDDDSFVTFEDWADELGFDTDSRKAERSFRLCKDQTVQLHEFLGDKFADYMGCEVDS